MRIWLKQFFSLSETTTSYKRPIIKLLLFPIIFLLIFFRPKFGITLIDGAVTVASIICFYFAVVYCLYIPFAEVLSVMNNRKNSRSRGTKTYKSIPVDQITSLVLSNDIIDIEIKTGNNIIHIGSSSDLLPGGSTFFDKRYYIGSSEYLDEVSFERRLKNLTADGKVNVVAIDDVEQGKSNTPKADKTVS